MGRNVRAGEMIRIVFMTGCFVFLSGVANAQETPKPPLPVDDLTNDFFAAKPPYPLPEKVVEYDEPTAKIVALGKKLFFDPILSIDKSVSCASCHDPKQAFGSTEKTSLGVNGNRTRRNSPTLVNRGFARHQFWDGRASSLEQQVLMPIQDQNEMALEIEVAIERLTKDAVYSQAFKDAFGDHPEEKTLARALASFVARIYMGRSPVDLFRAADTRHLDPAEKTGLWIYESKGRCWKCHSGPNFTDEKFHNTGVAALSKNRDGGRSETTLKREDRGKFKTPTLRALTFTAPYMHDGSMATLEDVVAFYRRGGEKNRNLDPLIEPIELTDEEAAALVAFLKALSKTVPEDDAKIGVALPK